MIEDLADFSVVTFVFDQMLLSIELHVLSIFSYRLIFASYFKKQKQETLPLKSAQNFFNVDIPESIGNPKRSFTPWLHHESRYVSSQQEEGQLERGHNFLGCASSAMIVFKKSCII